MIAETQNVFYLKHIAYESVEDLVNKVESPFETTTIVITSLLIVLGRAVSTFDDRSRILGSETAIARQVSNPKMDSAPPQTNGGPTSATQLPPEAIALAGRMFEAARNGDEQSVALLTQALQRGLPANLTNDKGDTLVSHSALRGTLSEAVSIHYVMTYSEITTNVHY